MGTKANASLLGLMVATGVFSVSATYVIYTAYQQPNPDQPVQAAEAQAQASSLADLILNLPGQNWYVAGACADGRLSQTELQPDVVERFGLAEEPCSASALKGAPNALSYHKVGAIHEAGLDADYANGKADYAETVQNLRLREAGYDFRLDAAPVLADVESALKLGKRNLNARPLLIGDFDTTPNNVYILSNTVSNALNTALNTINNQGGVAGQVGRQATCPTFGCNGNPWYPQATVTAEAAYVEALVAQFQKGVPNATYANDTLGVPYDAAGDVFPDHKRFLEDNLPGLLTDALGAGRLDHYNAIFVGANVKNSEIDSPTVILALQEWLDAGGYLIIFGASSNNNWMNLVVDAHMVDPGNGGATDVDATHPVITIPPPPLEYSTYAVPGDGKVFKFNTLADDKYEKVLWQSNGEKIYLAVSKGDGEFGDGRAALVAYHPSHIAGGTQPAACAPDALDASCQSLHLIHHLLTVPYNDLYVGYGPELPEGVPIGTHNRLTVVHHPTFGGAVELGVTIKAWPKGPYRFGPATDTTPPSQVGPVVATALSASQIRLTWPAATDNVGVQDYEVLRWTALTSPAKIADVAHTGALTYEYSDPNLLPLTTYFYTVEAVDTNGNHGDPSLPASATTLDLIGGQGGGCYLGGENGAPILC